MSGGFIRTIVFIVAVLIVLGYFGISLRRDIIENKTVQSNFAYAGELMRAVWNKFLEKPSLYLWNNVFKDLLKEGALNAISGVREPGSGTTTADFSGIGVPLVPMPNFQ